MARPALPDLLVLVALPAAQVRLVLRVRPAMMELPARRDRQGQLDLLARLERLALPAPLGRLDLRERRVLSVLRVRLDPQVRLQASLAQPDRQGRKVLLAPPAQPAPPVQLVQLQVLLARLAQLVPLEPERTLLFRTRAPCSHLASRVSTLSVPASRPVHRQMM